MNSESKLARHAAELRAAVCNKAIIKDEELVGLNIVRRSLDARKQPVFNFVVEFDCERELPETAHLKPAEVKSAPSVIDRCIAPAGTQRPVVVGDSGGVVGFRVPQQQ